MRQTSNLKFSKLKNVMLLLLSLSNISVTFAVNYSKQGSGNGIFCNGFESSVIQPCQQTKLKGIVIGIGSRQSETDISLALANILSNTDMIDTITAIQYRTRWALMEPVKGEFSFDHLLNQVRFVSAVTRPDGKIWRMQIFVSLFTGAPDWLYDDGVFPLYTMGRQAYSPANIPLPYDETYLLRAQEFLTQLHLTLKTELTVAEYQNIELMGVGGPGGYLDQFFPQINPDPILAATDDSARVNVRCPGTATPYYHDYSEEYGQNCFTGGNPYTPQPMNAANDVMYKARQQITDHLFALFGDDMHIERPLLMFTPNPNGNFKAQLADVLVQQIADNVEKYGEKYILKINALGSNLNPVRWDFENILEHHRVANNSQIAFEFVAANQIDLGASVKEIIKLGINRGASSLLLFPNLLDNNLEALEFAKDFFEGDDMAPPTAISDLLAVTGASSGEIVLSWSAPGDDDTVNGPLGTVSNYQIRFSTSGAILNQSDWDAATPYVATQLPIPSRVGKSEQIILQGFTPNTLYYLAVAAEDDVRHVVVSLTSPSAIASDN